MARGTVRCCRCLLDIAPGQEACFDDGADSHRRCTEIRNEALRKAYTELVEQDARGARQSALDMGLSVPDDEGSALWTPTTTISPTETATTADLDLTRGVLLVP